VRLHDESYDSDVFATAASSCRSCLVYAPPPPPGPPTHPNPSTPTQPPLPTRPPTPTPSNLYPHALRLCRYGMMECVLAAQEGGCGLIVYSRQEGNALGEVAKLLTLRLALIFTRSP
jgi:hypothetical protein